MKEQHQDLTEFINLMIHLDSEGMRGKEREEMNQAAFGSVSEYIYFQTNEQVDYAWRIFDQITKTLEAYNKSFASPSASRKSNGEIKKLLISFQQEAISSEELKAKLLAIDLTIFEKYGYLKEDWENSVNLTFSEYERGRYSAFNVDNCRLINYFK